MMDLHWWKRTLTSFPQLTDLLCFNWRSGEIAIVVESIDEPTIVFSIADDGFYWFLSLTDDCESESLVQSDQLYIYESIDIFDPA